MSTQRPYDRDLERQSNAEPLRAWRRPESESESDHDYTEKYSSKGVDAPRMEEKLRQRDQEGFEQQALDAKRSSSEHVHASSAPKHSEFVPRRGANRGGLTEYAWYPMDNVPSMRAAKDIHASSSADEHTSIGQPTTDAHNTDASEAARQTTDKRALPPRTLRRAPSRERSSSDYGRIYPRRGAKTAAASDATILTPIQAAYEDDLVYKNAAGRLTVNLATLQCINLELLRARLVEHACDIAYWDSPKASTSDDMRRDIHDYVEALRDWDYSEECARRGSEDPFVVSTALTLARRAVEAQKAAVENEVEAEGREGTRFAKDMGVLDGGGGAVDEGKVRLLNGSRNAKIKRDDLWGYLQRTGMAVLGGAFLVAPMVIMVLHNTRTTSLVTASVFVFVFGMVVAAVLEKPMEVLSVTAAYAAVLVVFVGTNAGGGSG